MTGITGTAASSADLQAAPAGHGGPDTTITLISGDQVRLRGAEPPVVRGGPGRAGMRFHISKQGADTHVLPYDAAALVAEGRVDRRLFNVTRLAELDFDDRSRGDIPLIVAGSSEKLRAMTSVGRKLGLGSVGAVALREPKAQAAEFWNSVRGSAKRTLATGVQKIWLDGTVEATLDRSVPQIGATAAWQAGHTGAGTKVAVLDTGIDTGHADLSDAVVQEQDFTGSESGTDDRSGHGTHVASIITGSGAASGGNHRGVAPDTQLLNGKVLGDDGTGSESGVLAGMEWAVAQGADVVNLSLGSSDPGDGTTPLEQAVDRLTAESGALFVVAAGNDGPGSQTVGSPASADAALAVGAVDSSDHLAEFSSRGPRVGDGAIKPDLTAPGVGIVAARAQHATVGEPVGAGYSRLSGTSMATPHVAGAAAILAGQHPDWTAGRLKAALMGTAEPNQALTVYQQGSGRVDVARATTQQVRPAIGSLNLGTAQWPHHDDQPITRTVTYHNDSDQPVTLTLSADDVEAPGGEPAPAGMFTVTAKNLTVPAHGSASAGLIAHPAVDGPDGTYKGALVASAGTTRVRITVALYREVESYDVTVKTVDWDGRPARPDHFLIANVDRPGFALLHFPEATSSVRLPKGRYYFDSFLFRINSEQPFSYSAAYFIEPETTVSGTTTLTLDARDTVPIGFGTDRPEAELGGHQISSWRDTPYAGEDSIGFSAGGTDLFPIVEDLRIRPSRTSAPGKYHFDLEGLLAKLDGNGGYTGSPYQYHLKWSEDGKVPTTLNRRFRDQDLAELRTTIAAQMPGGVAEKDGIAAITTPGTIVERYSPGFEFSATVDQWADRETGEAVAQHRAVVPRVFAKAGWAGTERWNVGPFMPAQDPLRCSCRTRDAMLVSLMPYSGQNLGHVGDAAVGSATTRLLRDGVQVASSASAGFLATEVPAGQATYRLETEAVRGNSPFSTRQSAAWTFRSGSTTESTPLPLTLIRFAPKLNDRNEAPAGGLYAVPVHLQVQHGAARGTLTSLKVEVSYDDGATWRAARLNGQTAVIEHPQRAGYVSLRATATDSEGTKAEQTVIHAYRLSTR
ncbi:S8 family serine peptidase [Kribbella flavida]|nr:S8 family peptidase [Kribbella flavida]